ncbi:MAG: conjugal transfer protein TraH, partial [Candidatus Nitrosotenuis sp.]
MRWFSVLTGISLICIFQSVWADINNDLTNFFDNLGFSNNVTGTNAYQGQQAGYYTGGSLYARNSVRDVQIAQIDLPSFRSGCGGIDLYTGGFSFVNSQELINTMQNIMNNAVGYSFNLALESATPEIANSMKYFNTLASQVNQFNINSCETAAGLVGT